MIKKSLFELFFRCRFFKSIYCENYIYYKFKHNNIFLYAKKLYMIKIISLCCITVQ